MGFGTGNKYKCEYCGSILESLHKNCRNCGASSIEETKTDKNKNIVIFDGERYVWVCDGAKIVYSANTK